MSREYFVESHLEDLVDKFMEEGISEEDAIQKATSFYDGQVNLVEEQALKINENRWLSKRNLGKVCIQVR